MIDIVIPRLLSGCCGAKLINGSMCSDCKEHADVYCETCGSEYEYGTESCVVCGAKEMTIDDVRDLLGRADGE